MTVPGDRLTAPQPGWSESADVVIVGSGIAGLSLALSLRSSGLRVQVVTKGRVDEGATQWAQGGIAAALDDEDSPQEHLQDTLVAGAGLCDTEAVRILVERGPAAVRSLVALGTRFDREAGGELSLTREGGHHRDRVAHAGGDATGREISRALVAAVLHDDGIGLYEQALALDLLTDAAGAVQGLTLHVMGQGQRDGVGAVLAPAVVLATGGLGQVFQASTNPLVATGDGVAMAARVGAAIADLEFVQFHPTVMWQGPTARGQQPLISEAVRGEGAVLLDPAGQPLMSGVHPLGDLAPRDVVAKAIMKSMRLTGAPHAWLDGRTLGDATWKRRFPTILQRCQEQGIDPREQLIPVVPAQHYASGGVRTDLDGRASIPGLFACGEVACTGVHGANRLASNSLLEGLVFAERIARSLTRELPERREPVEPRAQQSVISNAARPLLQRAMSDGAGVLRTAESLEAALAALQTLPADFPGQPSSSDWETTNLIVVASVLAHQALLRTETRGSHWREDFPEVDNERWRVHLLSRLVSGEWQTQHEPCESPRWETWV